MSYDSDVADREWSMIGLFFEQKRAFGRPLRYKRRCIVNAIFYVTKTGCQWRYLPKEYPPWKTAYSYFQRWCAQGVWEKTLKKLNQKNRLRQGKRMNPS